jgi:hypothetical protein
MGKGDAYLWSKFLDLNPNLFISFKYDVHVGENIPLPTDTPEWLRRSANSLGRKRIDVVAEHLNYIAIVEVRVNAHSDVIGDLIAYRYLYITSFNPQKPVTTLLVSDSIDVDTLICLKELSISYHIV